jgi:hypothetical protein
MAMLAPERSPKNPPGTEEGTNVMVGRFRFQPVVLMYPFPQSAKK